MATRSQGLLARVAEGAADLSTASFGMVMATGIIALAAHRQGWAALAQPMFLHWVPEVFLPVALAAWAMAAIGLARQIASKLKPATPPAPSAGA